MSSDIGRNGRSDRHFHADLELYFLDRYHVDGVPGATVEEGAVWTFGCALLTADAQERIDFNVAERRMVFVRDPIHALSHRTIGNARRRAGASGAAFGDNCQFFGPLLAGGCKSLRHWLHLDYSRRHVRIMTHSESRNAHSWPCRCRHF